MAGRVDRLLAIRATIVLVAWILAGLLLATQAWVSGALREVPVAWSQAAAIWLAWAGLWALLTPLVFELAARFPFERGRLPGAAVVHLAFGAALSAINLAAFSVLAPTIGATGAAPTWLETFVRLMRSAFLLNVPVYGLVVGVAHAMRLTRSARERELRASQLEAQLADARLLALRAQLQPHFLFNSLNTIAVLMREDVDAAERVLVLLSNLLRRSLEISASQEVELREELSFVEAYLGIEKARFPDRLAYALDAAPHLLDAKVPSLILQPFVENAVRHGLATVGRAGRIEVTAAQCGGMLQLCVLDNGIGMDRAAGEGIGLSNTRSRLALLYGDRHTLALADAPGGGLRVSMTVPLQSLETQ